LLTKSQVSELAPSSLQQPLSYLTGWYALFSWVSGIPACAQIMVGISQGMVLIAYPNAEVTTLWQTTLLIFAFLTLAFSCNIFLARHLPLIENVMVSTKSKSMASPCTDARWQL